jgi:DHA3 family macrolide efflux protein-like MFS transporter
MNRRLLTNRSFMALWVGQFISFIGDYFNYLAMPIVINRLTGSATMVGLSIMSTALPALILGPIAGVFVDRLNRRTVMIVSDVLRGVMILALLTVNSASQVWIFYLIGFLNSCASLFFFPARAAVLPLIVTDEEDWLQANGMMQIIQTIGLLAGPTLAGFTIGIWGEKIAFLVNSAGFFCSALAVMLIRVPRTTPGNNPSINLIPSLLADLREGVLFLFSSRTLIGVVICTSVAMLGVGAINVIWVPFLQRTFNIGAAGLGIVDSAQGVGMVAGGLLLGVLSSHVRKTLMSSVGICLIGITFASMGYSPTFYLIIAESFIVGLAIMPVNSALATIQQMAVPDLKRGRVGSSMNAITTSASLVSMALASFFGEMIGLRNVYLVIGGFIFFAGLLSFWLLQEPSTISSQNLAVQSQPGSENT